MTHKPDTLPKLLERIQKGAKARMKKCPQCGGTGQYQMLGRPEPGFARHCAPCKAYVALLALVEEKCQHPPAKASPGEWVEYHKWHDEACTGLITRTAYIESANIGMVEGGLIAALLPMFRGKGERMPLAHLLTQLNYWLCEEGGDHRIPALQAMARFLEVAV